MENNTCLLYVRNGKIKKAIKSYNETNEDDQITILSESKPIQDMVTIQISFKNPNAPFWLGAIYRTA